MQGRRSLKPTLLPLDDNIDKKKKKPLPFENPNPKPKETTTTMDALLHQPPRPNPQPNPRLMKDFGRHQVGGAPSCIVLSDAARNYELKTVHYNQLPSFHGSANEDTLTFIRDFYGIVQHFPLNDLTEDALRMRCFPYTLKDAAKTWFMTLTPGSLRTWPEVYKKFIGKFYSHAKTAELRRKIATFSQAEGEPFHEAWERFNMLLIQCPHHGYPLELQNQTFYDGLTQTSQSMVDNAAGGAMGEKTAEEISALYEMLGANSQQKSRVNYNFASNLEINERGELVSLLDISPNVMNTYAKLVIGVVSFVLTSYDGDEGGEEKLNDFGESLTVIIGVICDVVWVINVKYFLSWEFVDGWLRNFEKCTYYFEIVVLWLPFQKVKMLGCTSVTTNHING
nr:uncharacterized protein LOC109169442 [Ipomoea trifida]